MSKKKWRNFQASISDVKPYNPLFSTCKILVMYHGQNRNMSNIAKDVVEKALPSIKNIPIVGEFSIENQDFKGHGGAVSLDDYRFIHTTKPYGVVPESAVWEWEVIGGREYLTIDGCYLWTGRYEEATKVIERAKGQSMEIEVIDGDWDFDEDIYNIKSFNFSALCILGEDVEPAFEDASILSSYSIKGDVNAFKNEFNAMLFELKESTSNAKGEEDMKLKELLAKYNLSMEDITAKGIKLDEIAPEDLESTIVKAFEIGKEDDKGNKDDKGDNKKEDNKDGGLEDEGEGEGKDEDNKVDSVEFEKMQARVAELEGQLDTQNKELEDLREFKLETVKKEHTATAEKMFNDFQMTEDDIKDLDIHKFSVDELESKCFEIIGRKMAKKDKKKFSKDEDKNKDKDRKIIINQSNEDDLFDDRYGSLLDN